MAPAQIVSSKLNLSCQPEHKHNTFLSCLLNQMDSASRFKNEPTTTISASFATSKDFVPLVVVNTTSWPLNSSRIYENGEFPKSNPSTICPLRSAAAKYPFCLYSQASSTVGTGMIALIPLSKAAQIAEVARNTSITTTIS